jgi:hypothetical protein
MRRCVSSWNSYRVQLPLTVLFPLLWLPVTAVLLGVDSRATWVTRLAHSAVFLAGAVVFLAPLREISWSGSLVRRGGVAAAAMALPLAISATHLPPLVYRQSIALSLIVVGAAVEEIVFRQLMPQRCAELLARRFSGSVARFAGLTVPQFVFALSHGVGNIFAATPTLSGLELARLTASGLLLQCVQILFGTGAAIGTHAAINVALVLGTYFPSAPPGWPTVGLLFLCGLLLVAAADHARRCDRAATPTLTGAR